MLRTAVVPDERGAASRRLGALAISASLPDSSFERDVQSRGSLRLPSKLDCPPRSLDLVDSIPDGEDQHDANQGRLIVRYGPLRNLYAFDHLPDDLSSALLAGGRRGDIVRLGNNAVQDHGGFTGGTRPAGLQYSTQKTCS